MDHRHSTRNVSDITRVDAVLFGLLSEIGSSLEISYHRYDKTKIMSDRDHIIGYKYVVIETMREHPEGEALGIFDDRGQAIDFIMRHLEDYDYTEEALDEAFDDLEERETTKVGRDHYFKVSKTPYFFLETTRRVFAGAESSGFA